MTEPNNLLLLAEGVADDVAEALASVSVAYSHDTLNDLSTANRLWSVHESGIGNPFERNEWLGRFDNKAEAHELARKLRRERAVAACLRALAQGGPDVR